MSGNVKILRWIDLQCQTRSEAQVFKSLSSKGWKLRRALFGFSVICRRNNGKVKILCTICGERLPAGHNARYDRCFAIAFKHLQERHEGLAKKLEESV